ncbi:MAG: hypothetical protein M3323_12510 [Actinomycetota bacterium]|nr:hypothetical protein [Actinomycetota bacterium]
MPDNVALAVYGRAHLDDLVVWKKLLSAIEAVPAFTPERWGDDEASMNMWDGVDRAAPAAADALGFWGWTAGGGTVQVRDRQTRFDLHSWLEINAPVDAVQSADIVRAFGAFATALDANYGHLHLLYPPAWGDSNLRYVRRYGEAGARLSIPPWILELYLPNVYWGSILGPDYVAMFGRDKIRTTPCAVVEELPGGRFFLQATGDLNDCRTSHDDYVDAARAAMDHLGPDAFLDPRDYRRPGRTPDFSYLREEDPPRPYVPLAP